MAKYSRYVDFLEVDGGWWTSAALHQDVFPDIDPKSVDRHLHRLARAGRIRRRRRFGNKTGRWQAHEQDINEYAAA